jgi:hypothetical protein
MTTKHSPALAEDAATQMHAAAEPFAAWWAAQSTEALRRTSDAAARVRAAREAGYQRWALDCSRGHVETVRNETPRYDRLEELADRAGMLLASARANQAADGLKVYYGHTSIECDGDPMTLAVMAEQLAEQAERVA